MIQKKELRTELIKFAKILVNGYADESTILEILGTSDTIDDYIDNQLKERWEVSEKLSELKKELQNKIKEFKAYKTDPRYQTPVEQNAVDVTLRELKYLDSIAEYEN